MREQASNLKPVVALASALRAGSATGGWVDRIGFDAASILVTTGEYTNGSHEIVVEESDYADGVGAKPVAASSLTKALPVVNAADKANKATLVGYIGDARYLRIKSNVSGSPATGAVVGVTVLLGRARSKPVS